MALTPEVQASIIKVAGDMAIHAFNKFSGKTDLIQAFQTYYSKLSEIIETAPKNTNV